MASSLPRDTKQPTSFLRLPKEVMALIFKRLSFCDCHKMQHVCKIWRKTIVNDQATKSAMFYEPTKLTARKLVMEMSAVPGLKLRIPRIRIATNDNTGLVIAKIHPYLKGHVHEPAPKILRLSSRGLYSSFGCTLFFDALATHPTGKWRDAFLTQPPCKLMTVDVMMQTTRLVPQHRARRQVEIRDLVTLQYPTGITLGHLADALKDTAHDLTTRLGVSLDQASCPAVIMRILVTVDGFTLDTGGRVGDVVPVRNVHVMEERSLSIG